MKAELTETPFLNLALVVSYLLLGITDTIHHVHAALRLDQTSAMHAAVIGMILVPIATASVCLFKRTIDGDGHPNQPRRGKLSLLS